MSKKEIPNNKSESYLVKVAQEGREENNYYMAQILYNDGKYNEKWDVEDKGYYLFVISVEYDTKANKVIDHNIFFSDIKLLIKCGRRSEKNFNLALDMFYDESQNVINEIEKEKEELEGKGVTDDEIKNFLNMFKEEYEKEMKKENGMKYESKNELVKVDKKPEKEKITFKDVAGMEDVKEILLDVIDQFKNPEKYEYFDIKPIKSLLLYGKAGTGKTFIATAFANEVDAKFVKVALGDIGSKYQNETGNRIKKIFDDARRERGKVILYLDEVDSIATKRGDSSNDKEKNNTLNVLLTEMSSENNENIFILCATNFYELLDPAFIRSGRMDVKIEIPLPNFETRLQILELNTKKKPLSENVDLKEVAEKLEGKNCADVSLLCNQSARRALKKGKDCIEQEDFLEELDKIVVLNKQKETKQIGFDTKCVVKVNN